MTYVQGFVLAVPTENKERFRAHAGKVASLFQEHGAERLVEAWGDDVPDGKVTDFKGAVQAKEGETVVFAWAEYPSRAAYEEFNRKMREDPRMAEMGEVPFDGQRMIFGGFTAIVEEPGEGANGYVDGFVVPVPVANREAYRLLSARSAAGFKKHGATRVVEGWGDDVPEGKVTDFRRAVKAEEGETVGFSWIEWPSKAVRDEAWAKIMADPDMQPPGKDEMPFDGKRMFWGGFAPVIDQ